MWLTKIELIGVTYKDRINRLGFDVFKQICDFHDVKIVTLFQENLSK